MARLAGVRLKGRIKHMVHARTVQRTILATGSALALISAALGLQAQAENNLEASYTISFARVWGAARTIETPG
jgi:hypothetical protein